MSIKIAASILSADFSRLGEQVQEAIQAGVEMVHVDIMDGHFVPNMTIGPLVMEAIYPLTQAAGIPLDVHLMIDNPDLMIPLFAKAGAGILTVHVETCPHLHRTVQHIHELGVKAGVTLNPATSLSSLEEILPYVDQVLVMTVNPGFGGQSYIPTMTAKIARLHQMLKDRGRLAVDIEVDGGIKPDNAAQVTAAGATVLVVGSGIFNREAGVADNVAALRKGAASGQLRTFQA